MLNYDLSTVRTIDDVTKNCPMNPALLDNFFVKLTTYLSHIVSSKISDLLNRSFSQWNWNDRDERGVLKH